MNPPCAKCSKTVYPVEKLSCLNKVWHKGCFKCTVCEMTLNMKTYKGYNKLPYCNTHYPSTKFTPVADTPENKRLMMNTKNTSSVMYHKEAPTAPEPRLSQKAVADMNIIKSSNVPQSVDEPRNIISPEPEVVLPPEPPKAPAAPPKILYKCLYDYDAADDDEVSFQEGDIIEEGQIIDEGWMTGRVQRTNKFGMLPFNYLEQV